MRQRMGVWSCAGDVLTSHLGHSRHHRTCLTDLRSTGYGHAWMPLRTHGHTWLADPHHTLPERMSRCHWVPMCQSSVWSHWDLVWRKALGNARHCVGAADLRMQCTTRVRSPRASLSLFDKRIYMVCSKSWCSSSQAKSVLDIVSTARKPPPQVLSRLVRRVRSDDPSALPCTRLPPSVKLQWEQSEVRV